MIIKIVTNLSNNKNTFFCDVTPCSPVKVHWYFEVMFVNSYHTRQLHMPWNNILCSHCYENLKFVIKRRVHLGDIRNGNGIKADIRVVNWKDVAQRWVFLNMIYAFSNSVMKQLCVRFLRLYAWSWRGKVTYIEHFT